MLSLLLFLLLLSSGSVLLTAYRGRKYEESVPLTVFAAMEIVFLAGLAGSLRLGVYLLCALGAAAYALALRRVVRRRAWKAFARDTFTPGFFLFWGLLALYAVCVCGHVARHGDEFSFWAVSVKHMWVTDQFHSLTYSFFPEYPRGCRSLSLSCWSSGESPSPNGGCCLPIRPLPLPCPCPS